MKYAWETIVAYAWSVHLHQQKVRKSKTIEEACALLDVKYTKHKKELWQVAAAKVLDTTNKTSNDRYNVSQAAKVAKKMEGVKAKTYNDYLKTFINKYGNLNNCLKGKDEKNTAAR